MDIPVELIHQPLAWIGSLPIFVAASLKMGQRVDRWSHKWIVAENRTTESYIDRHQHYRNRAVIQVGLTTNWKNPEILYPVGKAVRLDAADWKDQLIQARVEAELQAMEFNVMKVPS